MIILKIVKISKDFFVWCNNLVSSHPILPKRIRALIKGEGSGDLYYCKQKITL